MPVMHPFNCYILRHDGHGVITVFCHLQRFLWQTNYNSTHVGWWTGFLWENLRWSATLIVTCSHLHLDGSLAIHWVHLFLQNEWRYWLLTLLMKYRCVRQSSTVNSLVGLRSASPTVAPHRQGSIPMSQTCDWCGSNPWKASPSRIGIGPSQLR
jgi:hypothetical protein